MNNIIIQSQLRAHMTLYEEIIFKPEFMFKILLGMLGTTNTKPDGLHS